MYDFSFSGATALASGKNQEKSSHSPRRKPVILCADDEKALLETLERQIARRFGRDFDVETAESGEEGLEVLQDLVAEGAEVALILSDHLMPGMKGEDFLAHAMKIVPDAPKILLTGQADMEAVVYAINHARLFRYIPKPWEESELIRTLHEATQIYKQKILLERYARLFHSINFATQRISAQLDKYAVCHTLAESAIQTCSASRVEVIQDDCTVCEHFNRDYVRQVVAAAPPSILDVPLYHGNRLLGRMIMENGHAFDQVDLEAAEILASQAAISITTARLYKDLADTARELDEHRQTLEKYNRDLTDSIVYARRIQYSILSKREILDRILPDNFVYYQPKDIVSGDFYFWRETEKGLTVAVCDCTGHGVPGAFVSLIAAECLGRSVKVTDDPAEILDSMEAMFKRRLKGQLDTVDLAVVHFDFANKTALFAGARRPLWLVRDGTIRQYPGLRKSLGENSPVAFENHEIPLVPGDVVYLFTDGVTDQFGGAKNHKFKPRRLKEFFQKVHTLPLAAQGEAVRNEIANWQGDNESTDDLLVLGVRYTG